VFAGQNVGVKEVSDKVWLVSYPDLAFGVAKECTHVQPLRKRARGGTADSRNPGPDGAPIYTVRAHEPTPGRARAAVGLSADMLADERARWPK
jgi:hypothetical protein